MLCQDAGLLQLHILVTINQLTCEPYNSYDQNDAAAFSTCTHKHICVRLAGAHTHTYMGPQSFVRQACV